MADRITYELEGLMLERLLCKAIAEGACLAEVRRLSRRSISVTANPRSARIIRDMAEKHRLQLRMTGITGMSLIFQRIKARATLAAAFVTATILSALFLSRIWIVDIRLVRGASAPEGTEAVLAECGIEAGAAIWDLDESLAALRLNALEGCAHASVTREGVAAIIEIACEEPSPALYDIETARDLVALCDGIISAVNVKSGTALVEPGDTVRHGDILIMGHERSSNDSVEAIGALGSVTARIWVSGEAQSPIAAYEKRYTGRESEYIRICTPWISWPLKTGDELETYDSVFSREYIGGIFVPLYIERELRMEYELTPAERDMDALRAELQTQATASARDYAAQNAPENAEIIDQWTDFSIIESDTLYARTVLELEAEIAVTRGYLEGY